MKKPETARKLLEYLIGFTLIVATFLTLHRFQSNLSDSDPDRYYHIAVSREISERGVIHTLPQVEGLRWNEYFPDKEFLYHAVTGSAYRLGGESLMLKSTIALSLLVPLLLFMIGSAWTLPRYA